MGRTYLHCSALWKWSAFLLLLSAAIVLLRRPTGKSSAAVPTKIEFLATKYPEPTWDGSYPTMVISWQISANGRIKFKASIESPKPSLYPHVQGNQVEVDLHSGRFVLRQTDLDVPDLVPLRLSRAYNSWDANTRAFGQGSNHSYDICPTGTRFPYTYMDLNLEDGRQIHFDRISKGTGYADAVYEHHDTSSEFYGARDAWNGDGWDIRLLNGVTYVFPEAYHAKSFAQGAAWKIRDGQGHEIELSRDAARNLTRVVSPSGHYLKFKYDGRNRIVEAADHLGNVRRYSYDRDGHLAMVSDGTHVLNRFIYEARLNEEGFPQHLMTSIADETWREIVRNKYVNGYISEQKLASGEIYRYNYIFDSNNHVTRATVTWPSGQKRTFAYAHGRPSTGRESN